VVEFSKANEDRVVMAGIIIAIIILAGFFFIGPATPGDDRTGAILWDTDFILAARPTWETPEGFSRDTTQYHDDGDFGEPSGPVGTSNGAITSSSGCTANSCAGLANLPNLRYLNGAQTPQGFHIEGWFKFNQRQMNGFALMIGNGLTTDGERIFVPTPQGGTALIISYNGPQSIDPSAQNKLFVWSSNNEVTRSLEPISINYATSVTNPAQGWNSFAIDFLPESSIVEIYFNGQLIKQVSILLSIEQVGIQITNEVYDNFLLTQFGQVWFEDMIITDYSVNPESGFYFDIDGDGTEEPPGGEEQGSFNVGETKSQRVLYWANIDKTMTCADVTSCSQYWDVTSTDGGTIEITSVEHWAFASGPLAELLYQLTFQWTPVAVGDINVEFTAKEPGFPGNSDTISINVKRGSGGTGPSITGLTMSQFPYFSGKDVKGKGGIFYININETFSFQVSAKKGTDPLDDFVMEGCPTGPDPLTRPASDTDAASTTFDCMMTETGTANLLFRIVDEGQLFSFSSVTVRAVQPEIIISWSSLGDFIVDGEKTIEVTFIVTGFHSSFSGAVDSSSELSILEEEVVNEATVDHGEKFIINIRVKAVKEGDYTFTAEAVTSSSEVEIKQEGEVQTPVGAVEDFFAQYGLLILAIIAAVIIYFVIRTRLPEGFEEIARIAAIVIVVALIVIGLIIAFVPEGIEQDQWTTALLGGGVIVAGFVMRSRTDIEETGRGDLFTIAIIGVGFVVIAIAILLQLILAYIYITLALVFIIIGVIVTALAGRFGASSGVGAPIILIGIVIFILAILGVFGLVHAPGSGPEGQFMGRAFGG
jgi:hypothetical protein